jgi:hypothetical protein
MVIRTRKTMAAAMVPVHSRHCALILIANALVTEKILVMPRERG